MKAEKFGNLFKITAGGTPSRNKLEYFANGDIPWVKTGDLGKKYITEPLEKINQLGLENSSAKKFPARTVLVAMYGATIGSCSILRFEACTNQACAAFLPNDKVNHEYLYYFLRSFKQQLVALGQGGGQPNISATLLKSVKIPLPPLDDQIRIAHLLSKGEGLIAQRKQNLQQLDELLKSVFLEMFGDPVRNEKGWDKKPFEKLLSDIESGWSPKCETRSASQDEWGVLKLGAVTSCYYIEKENKSLPNALDPKSQHEIKAGDLLFSRKNTYDLVAASAYVFHTRPKLLMPDLIFRFALKDKKEVNPLYLWKLLTSNSQRRKIQSLAGGAAGSMPNISKTNLKQVLLPIPPIEIQNQFAALVEKVQGIKTRYQQSLTELENLYGALSQKAFKGELDLSRVPLSQQTPDEVDKKIKTQEPIDDTEMKEMIQRISTLDKAAMSSVEFRRDLLKKCFHEWLSGTSSMQELSPDHFWQKARMSALDYMDEEEINADFSPTDYDLFKECLFDAIIKGEIEQTRNTIEVDGKPNFGNQIILKKGH